MSTQITPCLQPHDDTEFAERVRLNQSKLRAALKGDYDFIICGSGSSGSVLARRLLGASHCWPSKYRKNISVANTFAPDKMIAHLCRGKFGSMSAADPQYDET